MHGADAAFNVLSLAVQQRIEGADTLVLMFPTCWWLMPAIMKSWIDRENKTPAKSSAGVCVFYG
ncbi:NAD(P)H-dependent oxidoreductase [Thalassospira lucentensis]|nr:NAD(P)H-dependent oxidoreductase [Thalassospira lucentensis]